MASVSKAPEQEVDRVHDLIPFYRKRQHPFTQGAFGNSSDLLCNLAEGTAQAVTITDMPVGPYYLVMTTYDVSGSESTYSSMLTKNAE